MRVIKSVKELTLSDVRRIKDNSRQDSVLKDFIEFLKEDEYNKKCLVTALYKYSDSTSQSEIKDWDFTHITRNPLFEHLRMEYSYAVLVNSSILFLEREPGYGTKAYAKLKKAIRKCIQENLEIDLESLRDIFGTLEIAMQTEDPVALDYIRTQLRNLLEETS